MASPFKGRGLRRGYATTAAVGHSVYSDARGMPTIWEAVARASQAPPNDARSFVMSVPVD
jgi:hypothetical protein